MELTKAFEAGYVVFDLETTGGKNPEIIQVSAVRYDKNGNKVAIFDRYVSDAKAIGEKARQVTGLTTEFLRSAGVPSEEVIKGFKQFIGNDVIVGHNIKGSDIPKLNKAFEALGLGRVENDFVDTYRWSQHLIKSVPSYSLETLSQVLHIGQTEFHNALADCYTTKFLFEFLCKICPKEGYDTWPKNKPVPIGEKERPDVPTDRLAFYIEFLGNTAEVSLNRFEPRLRSVVDCFPDVRFKTFYRTSKDGTVKKSTTVFFADMKRDLRSFLDMFPGSVKVLRQYNRWRYIN